MTLGVGLRSLKTHVPVARPTMLNGQDLRHDGNRDIIGGPAA
jgi:hypothetical protein